MENKTLKMNILGGMHSYILTCGNATAQKKWFTRILPENCTEEDLDKIATYDALWNCACSTFGRLLKTL